MQLKWTGQSICHSQTHQRMTCFWQVAPYLKAMGTTTRAQAVAAAIRAALSCTRSGSYRILQGLIITTIVFNHNPTSMVFVTFTPWSRPCGSQDTTTTMLHCGSSCHRDWGWLCGAILVARPMTLTHFLEFWRKTWGMSHCCKSPHQLSTLSKRISMTKMPGIWCSLQQYVLSYYLYCHGGNNPMFFNECYRAALWFLL